MAKRLSKMTIDQLRAEIARRQTGLPKLQKKRAKLLKAVGKLDRQIAALGGQIEQPPKPKGRPTKAAKSTASSGKSLAQCIRDVLGGSRGGMRVKDIVAAVQEAGYKSVAKDFYHLVAAAVRGDEFKKLGRGIYKLKTGKAAVKKAKKVSKKSPKAGVKKAATPKVRRKRKKYAQTAEQLVLGLVKGKGATTAEINRAWKDAGRTGRADNTLNKMLKAGKVKRTPLKGQKGSTYTVA
jgi:hypothetical protein